VLEHPLYHSLVGIDDALIMALNSNKVGNLRARGSGSMGGSTFAIITNVLHACSIAKIIRVTLKLSLAELEVNLVVVDGDGVVGKLFTTEEHSLEEVIQSPLKLLPEELIALTSYIKVGDLAPNAVVLRHVKKVGRIEVFAHCKTSGRAGPFTSLEEGRDKS
jgi:hypothetical protein